MRYFLAIIGVVFFIVLAIILIVSSGRHNSQKPINVTNYNYSGTTMVYTENGILNGEDIHRAIRISISNDTRVVDILGGYEPNILQSETLPNTPAAYGAFLQALEASGFAQSRSTNEPYKYGVCPTGYLYNYEILTPNGAVSNLWGDECSASDGTFAGNAQEVQVLFQNQISNYTQFIGNTNLDATTPS